MKFVCRLLLFGLLPGCADVEEFLLGPDDYGQHAPAPTQTPAAVDPSWRPSGPQFGPPPVGTPAAPRNAANFQPAAQTREPDLAR